MKILLLLLVTSLVFTEILCGRNSKKVKSDEPPLSEEARLYDHLISNYDRWNPDRALRPVYNRSETMHVSFGVALLYFNFDSATDTAWLNTWDQYLWNDYYLQWKPADYGDIQDLRIPVSKIWKPNIALYNAVEPSVCFDDALAVVSSDGSVRYWPSMRHHIRCSSDSTHVYCNLKFGSRAFDGFQQNLDFLDRLEEMDLSDFIRNNNYEMLENSAQKNVTYYPCCDEPYPDLTFSTTFKKRSEWWNGKK